MLIAIQTKYLVSQAAGTSRARASPFGMHVGERERNFLGQHFGAMGCFVLTIGHDEELIREFNSYQKEDGRHLEQ